MKIRALTNSPQRLINAINKAIKDGDLKTWERVENLKKETLYSHVGQWAEKAMPKPYTYNDSVIFKMKWWLKNEEPSEETKGYILGRFTELLMVHFRNYFNKLVITE